jgi:hypothetical protein
MAAERRLRPLMNSVPWAPLQFCAPPPRRWVIKAALADCRQPLTDSMSDDTLHPMRISSSENCETCIVNRAVASALSIRSDGL